MHMTDLILKDESYELIGICMEVHREPGMGFREIIYKDALEYEFETRRIPYNRERGFEINTKRLFFHAVIMQILLFIIQLFLK